MFFLRVELVPFTSFNFNLKFPVNPSVNREFGDAVYSDSKILSSLYVDMNRNVTLCLIFGLVLVLSC